MADDQVWADILCGIEVTEPSGDLLVSVGRPIIEKLVLLAVAKKIETSFATAKAAADVWYSYEVDAIGDRGELSLIQARFKTAPEKAA